MQPDGQRRSVVVSRAVVVVVLFLGSTRGASSQDGDWSSVSDVQFARTGLYGGAVDGKIYAIGGSATANSATLFVEEYDPAADAWTRKSDMPVTITFGASEVVDGKIYVISGAPSPFENAVDPVLAYDPGADAWEARKEIPTPRVLPATAVVDGKIYVIGGCTSATTPPFAVVEVYDPATDSWTARSDMPTPRCGASAAVAGGNIYVMGGTSDDYVNVTYPTVEEYDPEADVWTAREDMPTARWGLAACSLNDHVYALGGQSGLFTRPNVQVYDAGADSWGIVSSMVTERRVFVCATLEGKIYSVAGSQSFPGVPLNSVEVFSPGSGTARESEEPGITTGNELYPNFPNPFTGVTTIAYLISASLPTGHVTLKVYNSSGQFVRTLIDRQQASGRYSASWDGRDDAGRRVSSGFYFYRLSGQGMEVVRGMLLIE